MKTLRTMISLRVVTAAGALLLSTGAMASELGRAGYGGGHDSSSVSGTYYKKISRTQCGLYQGGALIEYPVDIKKCDGRPAPSAEPEATALDEARDSFDGEVLRLIPKYDRPIRIKAGTKRLVFQGAKAVRSEKDHNRKAPKQACNLNLSGEYQDRDMIDINADILLYSQGVKKTGLIPGFRKKAHVYEAYDQADGAKIGDLICDEEVVQQKNGMRKLLVRYFDPGIE